MIVPEVPGAVADPDGIVPEPIIGGGQRAVDIAFRKTEERDQGQMLSKEVASSPT
ncbi:hypothetical protein SAMN02745673_00317 [Marinactinospora thermotolerans DSM 45154]|uniref:Uncharacterized protein n=1 Tax=Marinactinospora thermotolerans DSM 45154 TaxID=1122192 RepID=A0A1T4KD29_9ACTN|nr:hypothetical protein SAMN02745673_00317 [Marinactinospora thermotolerans DSM 45154]